MSTLKVATIQDTSGSNSSTPSEVANGRAKAWINMNGQGTIAIKDSYNISSITDNGTGDYSITFTSAMANANYAYAYGLTYTSATRESVIQLYPNTQATTGFRILTGFSYTSPSSLDVPSVSVIILGD